MKNLDEQIRAVSMALRDARRDATQAKESGKSEWIEDSTFVVEKLQDVLVTLNEVKQMTGVLNNWIGPRP